MRHHSQIIDDAGGYAAFATKLGIDAKRVRFWRARSSIPAPYWIAICKADLSSLEELASAVSDNESVMAANCGSLRSETTRNGDANSGEAA